MNKYSIFPFIAFVLMLLFLTLDIYETFKKNQLKVEKLSATVIKTEAYCDFEYRGASKSYRFVSVRIESNVVRLENPFVSLYPFNICAFGELYSIVEVFNGEEILKPGETVELRRGAKGDIYIQVEKDYGPIYILMILFFTIYVLVYRVTKNGVIK